jgi:hypothetical protein
MSNIVEIGRALFGICYVNDMKSYNLLRPSFDLLLTFRESYTSRAYLEHVGIMYEL